MSCGVRVADLEAPLDHVQRVVCAALHVLLALRRRVERRHADLGLARALRDVDVRHVVVLAAVRADAAAQALCNQDLQHQRTRVNLN